MKLMHIADLHLGKRLNGFSLIEDQAYILDQIGTIAAKEGVDAVLIAGDVYDRPIPPEQAVRLLDGFLEALQNAGIEVFLVAGNHDSAVRLSFLSATAERTGIHLARPYAGAVESWRFERGDAAVMVHALPFVTPSEVKRFHGDGAGASYDEALRTVVGSVQLAADIPNVLVAHQLVLGSAPLVYSDSEQVSIGGLDQIGVDAFAAFDYVALGHIHAPQWAKRPEGDGRGGIRYSGSPLMYSFSECGQQKSVTLVDIDAAGKIEVSTPPLAPLHGMREVRGTIVELRELAQSDPTLANDYVRVTLTEPVMDAKARLDTLFPLVMRIDFDYMAEGAVAAADKAVEDMEQRSPVEVFELLFEATNGRSMREDERAYFVRMTDEILNGEEDAR